VKVKVTVKVKLKQKSILEHAWKGPECYRKLKLPDTKTIGT